jgi:hypothetical protein
MVDSRSKCAGRKTYLFIKVLRYSIFEQQFRDLASLGISAIIIYHVTQNPVNYALMVNLKSILAI